MKKGFVLFAEPTVQHDLTFSRSVILIVEQNENGIVGFIINKKTDYSTIDLIPELNINFPIYNGGPVEKENLYFIHKIPSLIKNSIKIKDNLYWGGNFDLVVELINENKIKKNINVTDYIMEYQGLLFEVNAFLTNPNTHKRIILQLCPELRFEENMLE